MQAYDFFPLLYVVFTLTTFQRKNTLRINCVEHNLIKVLRPINKTKMESIRKLSYFNLQWTKTLYKNNYSKSFLHFWRAIKSYINNSKEKVLVGAQTNLTKLQKLQISQNEILCMIIIFTCVFSIPAKFEIIFWALIRNIVFVVITYNY